MAKEPLQIDWKEMLPGVEDGPPPEVEVIDAAPAEASELAHLSDQELGERIQRLVKHLSSEIGSRLADSGAKLSARVCFMQAELDRRKLAHGRKDAGGCSRVTQLKSTESTGTVNDCSINYTASVSHSESSFTSKFLEKLQGKADAASSEDFKVVSQDTNRGTGKNELQRIERGHQVAMSSRQTPFQCVSSLAKKEQKRSLNGDVDPSNLPEGKTSSNSKRRRASNSEGKNSAVLKWKKVREVVLLDEEEVHAVQPTEDGSDKWKEMKVYYPSRDDPESVELSYTDIKCLDPESYLSSTIMNFYIRLNVNGPYVLGNHQEEHISSYEGEKKTRANKYLQRPLSVVDRPRGDYHFFNTYFYKKLEEAVSRKACFEKLRRWWKGINLFQKSYIFIPVHGDMHWSLVIICIPAKEDESGPIVLHLDSLGIHNSYLIFDIIDRYLKEEWEHINQNSPLPDLPISEKIWRHLSRRIEKKKIPVPQQKNEYDCGLFVLYFMERFIEEAPERLKRKDLAMFGSKWFQPEEASGLRKRIRGILIEVFRSAKTERNKAETTSSSGSSEDD